MVRRAGAGGTRLRGGEDGNRPAAGSRQNVSPGDATAEFDADAAGAGQARPAETLTSVPGATRSPHGTPLAWIASLIYAAMFLVMQAACFGYFRRVTVRHLERFPGRGAVLVIANHPATWTDVLVLDVALRRKLHFLAHGSLFHPWARRWLLALYGALPVYQREDAPGLTAHNVETFRLCHGLFERGEVVATFPEGVSVTDRHILPLKTGAARLALGYDLLPARAGRLAVVPVGIHFHDRTAFRSEVEVAVGPAVELASYRRTAEIDPQAAVHDLTRRLFEALKELVVHVSEPALETLVQQLAPIVIPHRRARRGAATTLELARELAATIERMGAEIPGRLAVLRRALSRYVRMRQALGLSERVLRDPAPRAEAVVARLIVRGLLGIVPASIGAAIHIVPHLVSAGVARRVAHEPSHVAFSRIGAGMVLFPLNYAVWGWLLWRATSLPHVAVAVLLAIGAVLGLVTLAWLRLLREDLQRYRLLWLERRRPQLVARARAARAAVLGMAGEACEEMTP